MHQHHLWRKIGVREIAVASILGALSAMLKFQAGPPFSISFPLYPRIAWDFAEIPIFVSLFLCGPLCGIYTSAIGCSIIFLRGNVTGGIFKIIAEFATIIGYAVFKRNFALDAGKATLSRVVVMTVANYYLLPFFYGKYGTTPEVAAALLAPIAIFNVSQALINIIPAYAIYKKIVGKIYSAELKT
ncbi:MAG: ECF transporter S component [Candidatus Bathyarchaeales archaeon]